MAPLIVLGTLNMASGVLAVAGLGFLGLGLQPPTPEWGVMLNNAKTALTVAPHVMIFPGLALVLLVTACNLLGDGLRELLDPRLRQT
jgi:peptide/nickel transport system permease protein